MFGEIVTVENALECMLEFEDEYDLFNTLENNGEKTWIFFRLNMWNAIVENVSGQVTSFRFLEKKMDKLTISEEVWRFFFRNPFLAKKVDLLVLGTGRRMKYGSFYKDIYIDSWLNECRHSNCLFERAFYGHHFQPAITKNLKFFSMDEYAKFAKIKKNEESVETLKLKKIIEYFEMFSGLTFTKNQKKNMIRAYVDAFKYHDYYISVYKHLLERISPKAVVFVNYCNLENLYLIECAKSLGIKTIEIDHGGLVDNFVYSFKSKHSFKQFPDYILSFGEYERDFARVPFSAKHIIPVGSIELELAKQYYASLKKRKKKKKIITFISSSTKELAKCAYELSMLLDESYKIYFKLHPSEYSTWKEIYPTLNNSNITVADDSRHNIYYYLAISDYVIGVGSTSMLEATAFDGIIILLKAAYYRGLSYLVQNGDAFLAESTEQVFEIINKNKTIHKLETKYYKKNALKNTLEAIDKIIT